MVAVISKEKNGSQFHADARELWRRMLFNILCNNTDDHLRNHGFLWDGKGWRLSPAYDIVPLPQIGIERYLAIGVGQKGRQATIANALTAAASFDLSLEEAKNIAFTLQQEVKSNWEKIFKASGFSATDIERMHSCFLACEEPII